MRQKRKYSWRRVLLQVAIATAVVILGWYCVGRALSPWRAVLVVDSGEPHATSRLPDQPLRVVAYNIAHGRGTGDSNWTDGDSRRKRLSEIATMLRELVADVVVLNEVDFSCVWSGHQNQAEMIGRDAGYRYRAELSNIDASVPFVRLRFGNVVLSRYPIVEAELINLPGHAGWETLLGGKKRAVACTIELDDGSRIVVVAAHLEPRGDETIRTDSARKILDAVSGLELPTIIAGDLNSTLPGLSGARLDGAGHTGVSTLDLGGFVASPTEVDGSDHHAFTSTFPSWQPDRTIDWVLVRPPLHVMRVEVKTADLSDHLPVVAEIRRGVSD